MALFKISEKNKPVITVVAILAIVASLTSIVITQCERPPKINLQPFYAVGQVAAEETLKLLNNNGKIVVVVMDTGDFKSKATDAQLQKFNETIKKQAGASVTATEKVKMDMMMMGGPEMGLPGDFYIKLLQQHPEADAIVSFVGAPSLTDDQIKQLGDKIPKFVAISNMGMGLKKLFENQVIQVAIMPQFTPPAPDAGGKLKTPQTLREWFDQTYTVVTAENASTLPF